MKLTKHKELLIIIAAAFGIFLVAGLASASNAETLQPSEDGLQPAEQTTNFESIRVGVAGQGGVTFFNGSVLNEEGPYVIADDLRVDGAIWRGPSKGTGDNQPLKIADTLMPALDNVNDIGMGDNQWRNIYYRDTLQGGSAHVEELTADTGRIANELLVSDYISVGGGYGNTGATIDTDGNIVTDGHLVAAGAQLSGGIDVGEIGVDGALNQPFSEHGAVKATIYYTPVAPTVCGRSWRSEGTVNCTRTGTGAVNIDFSSDVNYNYWQVTTAGEDDPRINSTQIHPSDNSIIQVYSYDGWTNPGDRVDTPFILTLY